MVKKENIRELIPICVAYAMILEMELCQSTDRNATTWPDKALCKQKVYKEISISQ